VRARKRFGQHFLEAAWARKVVDAIAPSDVDTFLEIGPGRGALTRPLASRAGRVVAVELDRDLAAELEAEHLGGLTVVRVIFCRRTSRRSACRPTRVAGNLPYNVSSPILIRLLELSATPHRFRDATVMLQKEVADRVLAGPGGRDYGPLAIFVAVAAKPSRLLTLPPGAFRPMPEVTSAVVRLDFSAAPPVSLPSTFGPLVRGIFTMRRKMLANAMAPVAASLNRQPAAVLGAHVWRARRRACAAVSRARALVRRRARALAVLAEVRTSRIPRSGPEPRFGPSTKTLDKCCLCYSFRRSPPPVLTVRQAVPAACAATLGLPARQSWQARRRVSLMRACLWCR
jgi:16S rRNA (adenine1518-N6/adenine1519-N6)-dimethyltransferase